MNKKIILAGISVLAVSIGATALLLNTNKVANIKADAKSYSVTFNYDSFISYIGVSGAYRAYSENGNEFALEINTNYSSKHENNSIVELNANGSGFWIETRMQAITSVVMSYSSNNSSVKGNLYFSDDSQSYSGDQHSITTTGEEQTETYICSDPSSYHYITCWIYGGTSSDDYIFALKSITINYTCE